MFPRNSLCAPACAAALAALSSSTLSAPAAFAAAASTALAASAAFAASGDRHLGTGRQAQLAVDDDFLAGRQPLGDDHVLVGLPRNGHLPHLRRAVGSDHVD